MKVRIQKITSVFLAVVLSLFAFVTPAFAAGDVISYISETALSSFVSSLVDNFVNWVTANDDSFIGYWRRDLLPADKCSAVTISQLYDIQGQLSNIGISTDVVAYPELGGYVLQSNKSSFVNPNTGEIHDASSFMGYYLVYFTGDLIVGFTNNVVITEYPIDAQSSVSAIFSSDGDENNRIGNAYTMIHGLNTSNSNIPRTVFSGTPLSSYISVTNPDIAVSEFDEEFVSGTLAIYISFYYYADSTDNVTVSRDYVPYNNDVTFSYRDSVSNVWNYSSATINTFVPVCGYPHTTGQRYSASISYTAGSSYDSFQFYQNTIVPGLYSQFHIVDLSQNIHVYACYPSASVFWVRNDDVLANLEGIADQLVSIDSTLQAMYGDIVSLLNDIYTRLGSIQSVESAANTYLSSIFSKVSSVESVL